MFRILTSFVLVVSSLAAPGEVRTRTLHDGNLVLQDIPPIPASLKADLQRYQNVRSAAFLDWTLDGKQILISTRFGEVSQVHRVDRPGGARRQLTFFKEPVGGVRRRPGSDKFLFSMDQGGSENHQLFVFDPEKAQHRRLTEGGFRNGSGLWSRDGKLLAYRSTRRNGRSNDVWLMEVDDPGSARLVLEAPDGTGWGPSDFSADARQLLVSQYISAVSSRLHLVDLESGKWRVLVGGEDTPGRNSGAALDASGKGFFYLTDAGSEFLQLAHRPLEGDGEVRIITKDIPWDVRSYSLSDNLEHGSFVTNENGLSRLYLFDPATLRYRAVEGLPVGLLGGATFSPDGTRLALTMNTARTPSDAFVLDLADDPLAHGRLTRWTFSEVGGLWTPWFIEPQAIHYPTFDEVGGEPRKLPAFVYQPKGKGPHPVIISIHGGPEGQFRPGFSSKIQLWVAKLGAAVIAPNVRGSSGYGRSYLALDNGFKREDAVKDIGALLDWIAKEPQLDENRVAVVGGSYGGYMVLASAARYSDRLKAAIDIVGISNFVTFLENTRDYRRDLRRVEYGDERDPAMRAHLEEISPLNKVDRIKVPLFVVQGQNDPRVPVTEAEQVVEAVRARGQTVWYMNALNEGHGYRRKENRDTYAQAVVLFLREHL